MRWEDAAMADIRETRHVAASAEEVYDLVADLPRMGEWSPECERVTWRGSATRAVTGARFVGHNRVGAFRWFTWGEIVGADRGRNLAFEVNVGPVPLARWEYFFIRDDEGDGCTVVEEWTDRRPAWYAGPADRLLGSRPRRNTTGMQRTLDAVKRAAEAHPVH